jgi:hypothetical protein
LGLADETIKNPPVKDVQLPQNADIDRVKEHELRRNAQRESVKLEKFRHERSSSVVESSIERTKDMRESGDSLSSLRVWFDEVMWVAVPSGKKRSKAKTWEAVEKLKPDQATREEIVAYLQSYPNIEETYQQAGQWYPEMQDPERVIKNKRFKDYLVPCTKDSKGEFLGVVYTDKDAYERAKANGETNIRYQGRDYV